MDNSFEREKVAARPSSTMSQKRGGPITPGNGLVLSPIPSSVLLISSSADIFLSLQLK